MLCIYLIVYIFSSWASVFWLEWTHLNEFITWVMNSLIDNLITFSGNSLHGMQHPYFSSLKGSLVPGWGEKSVKQINRGNMSMLRQSPGFLITWLLLVLCGWLEAGVPLPHPLLFSFCPFLHSFLFYLSPCPQLVILWPTWSSTTTNLWVSLLTLAIESRYSSRQGGIKGPRKANPLGHWFLTALHDGENRTRKAEQVLCWTSDGNKALESQLFISRTARTVNLPSSVKDSGAYIQTTPTIQSGERGGLYWHFLALLSRMEG